jgi:ADP-heptose:LPS heptosyltransferase
LWAALGQRLRAAGREVVFSSGTSERERQLLGSLAKEWPEAICLSAVPDLSLFLAVIKRSGLFISGDTGPLHFAAGLGVRTIGLFAATPAQRWAPIGLRTHVITGDPCSCSPHAAVCTAAAHCMASISVDQVFAQCTTAV